MASSNRPTSEQIKAVRDKMRKSFKTQEAKAQWKQVYEGCHLEEAYGYDPNKKSSKSKIGKGATTHILNSNGIREELEDQTPIDHPPIIPPDCDLTFFYEYDLSQYHPLCAPLCIANLFENIHSLHEMKNIFNDRLYSSKIAINIGDTEHEFWVKSFKQSGSGFVRQFGIQISKYIMRYRPVLYVALGPIIMILRGKNIGIGFCNLVANNKGIEGHKMLQFETETMQQITIEFYGLNTSLTDIRDIALKVRKYEQKGGKITPTAEEPLVLFDGRNGAQYDTNDTNDTQEPDDPQSDTVHLQQSIPMSPVPIDNMWMANNVDNKSHQYNEQGSTVYTQPNVALTPSSIHKQMNQWFPPCVSPVPTLMNMNDESESPLSTTTPDYTAFPPVHHPQPTTIPTMPYVAPPVPQHVAQSYPFPYNLPPLSMAHHGNDVSFNNPPTQHRTFQNMNAYDDPRNGIHRRIMNEMAAEDAHLRRLNCEARIRALRGRMNNESNQSIFMPMID